MRVDLLQFRLKAREALARLDAASQKWYVGCPVSGFYWVSISDEDMLQHQIPEAAQSTFREWQHKFAIDPTIAGDTSSGTSVSTSSIKG